MKLILLLVLVLTMASFPLKSDAKEPLVRVIIFDDLPEVGITTDGEFRVRSGEEILKRSSPNEWLHLRATSTGIALVEDASCSLLSSQRLIIGSEDESAEFELAMYVTNRYSDRNRTYKGTLDVFQKPNGTLEGVLELPMEQYLRGVVPSEIGVDAPLEAMKAQAVAARSETWISLNNRRYAGERYDLCSDVRCQVFTGTYKSTPLTNQAVDETQGVVMYCEGQPVSGFYAACCGGHSENSEDVWPERGYFSFCRGDFDHEQSKDMDLTTDKDLRGFLSPSTNSYCHPDTPGIPDWCKRKYRWTRRIPAAKITEIINEIKPVGRILALKPLERGLSGRLMKLEFVGEEGSFVVGPELAIRRTFSPSLSSAMFVIDTEGDEARPDAFILTGGGSGHGVGMCQVGAMGMAGLGKTYKEILQHYYRGVIFKEVY